MSWLFKSMRVKGVLLVLMLTGIAVAQETTVTPFPSFSDIIQASEAAYKQRAELLRHSTGRAHVRLRTSTSYDRRNAHHETGDIMDVSWFISEDNLRYDTEVCRMRGFEPWGNGSIARTCTNGRVGIKFSPYSRKAYLIEPPFPTGGFSTDLEFFDPQACYMNRSSRLPFDAWRTMVAHGDPIWLEYWEVDCVPCVCVTFGVPSPKDKQGYSQYPHTQLWFAAEQNFALVRLEGSFTSYRGRVATLLSGHQLRATYEESPDYHGVWLLISLYRYQNDLLGQFGVQRKTEEEYIDFQEVHLGVNVPNDTFNFPGLGVPVGSPIFDRRVRGATSIYQYASGVYVGLDRIELPTSARLPEDWAMERWSAVLDPFSAANY